MFFKPSLPSLARRYASLSQNVEDTESLLPSKSLNDNEAVRKSHQFTVVSTATLLLFSIASATIGFYAGQNHSTNLDSVCTSHTTKYSPILDEGIIQYEIIQYDGRFIEANEFRKEASPEVDAAWESLGVGYQPMLISDEQAMKSGLTRNNTHRNPELGGGYPVFLEGLHQLHCLNLVRQALWYNIDYYKAQGQGAFSDSPEALKWHVSHCLDIVRQRLMCTVDTGVFGGLWVNRTEPHTFVDFNTKHVCKNYDVIRAYAERNQMKTKLPENFWENPIPEDVYIWEYTP